MPKTSNKPWDLDLEVIIHNILGKRRKVIPLGHGEAIKIKDVTITSFPFVEELPPTMTHQWNCYLLEGRDAAVACTADSVVENAAVEFLTSKMRKSKRDLLLCGRLPHQGLIDPCYRDVAEYQGFFNSPRLAEWFQPVGDFFHPSQRVGPSFSILQKLSKSARLKYYFPYASGATPWFRTLSLTDAFFINVVSLTKKEWRDLEKRLSTMGLKCFPAQYGRFVEIRAQLKGIKLNETGK